MKISRIIAAACAIAIALGAWAQNATMTPYSRYGYGMLTDNATSAQRAMGGVGYAMNSGRQINVKNPASYAAIDSLTFLFDMGMNLNNLWASEGGNTERSMSGGLDYITMAFPITRYLGASLGVLPFSSTGYAFSETITNGAVSRTGSGDIYQLYAGLGAMPLRNFYIGANVGYLFGSNLNDVYATTITGSTSIFQRYMKVRDWKIDLGVQYNLDINADNRVTLGLSFSPGKGLRGETYGLHYDSSTSSTAKPDTTGYTNLKGLFSLPATYGAGISYTWRSKLLAEVDFTYQPWKDAKYAAIEDFEVSEFDNRWKLAAGVQYTPAPRGTYVQRIMYRAGVYYNHDYINIRGNGLREIGASVGFGFPVPNFKSIVSLSFEYKHRQATPNPLIKEQYFNVSLGINFNEMWFRKAKIY